MLALLLEVFEYQYNCSGLTMAGYQVPTKAHSHSPLQKDKGGKM